MSKYLLILDAGHAKDTAGKKAFDNSLYEWDFNNNMQYLIKKRAQDHGITVKLTNPNPQSVSDITLSVRSAFANKLYSDLKKPNTLFISLHANAYGSAWNTARGVEVYHASNASQNSTKASIYLLAFSLFKIKKERVNISKTHSLRRLLVPTTTEFLTSYSSDNFKLELSYFYFTLKRYDLQYFPILFFINIYKSWIAFRF